MVMDSWWSSAWQAEQEDEAAQNAGDVPYAAPARQPAVSGPINPTQGGFRDPVYNPANVAPPPINVDFSGVLETLASPLQQTIIGGAPIGYSQGPAAFSPPTYEQGTRAEIPYAAQVQSAAGDVGERIGDPFNQGWPTGDVGRFLFESSVPTNVSEAALTIGAGVPSSRGPIEAFTNLPIDDFARGAWRGAMPEPSLYPGFSAGAPPPQDWDALIRSQGLDPAEMFGEANVNRPTSVFGEGGASAAERDAARQTYNSILESTGDPGAAADAARRAAAETYQDVINSVGQNAAPNGPILSNVDDTAQQMQSAFDNVRREPEGGGLPRVTESPLPSETVTPPPSSPADVSGRFYDPAEITPALPERTLTRPDGTPIEGPGFTMAPSVDEVASTLSESPAGARVLEQSGGLRNAESPSVKLYRDAVTRAEMEIPVYTAQDALGRLAVAAKSVMDFGAGRYTDSFLNEVLTRSDQLRNVLEQAGTAPRDLESRLSDFREALVRQHYQGNSSRVQDTLNAIEKHYRDGEEIAKDFARVNEVVGAFKNVVYGMADIGYFGQTMLAGLIHSGPQVLVGGANRLALALHSPVALDLEKAYNVPRLLIMQNMGLDLSKGASVVERGAGSPLGLIPGLKGVDRRTLGGAIEKLSDAQFKGVGGFMKAMDAEGSLAIAYTMKFLQSLPGDLARGANPTLALEKAKQAATDFIMNPANQRSTMNKVNHDWSTGARALTPGRAELERQSFLSPSFFRSKIDRVMDMTKLVSPGATPMERALAAQSAAAYAVFILGAYQYINDKVGVGDAVTDPFEYGFGRLTLPIRNSEGERITINLVPQASFQNLVTSLTRDVGKGDWQAAGNDALRYGFGSLNLIPKAGFAAGGYGYDSKGKFHSPLDVALGEGERMSLSEAGKANIPAPPVIQNQILGQNTDLASQLITGTGTSNYGEKPISEFMAENADKKGALNSALMDRELLNRAFPNNPEIALDAFGQEWASRSPYEKQAIISEIQKTDPARAKELQEAEDAQNRLNEKQPSAIGNASKIREQERANEDKIRAEYAEGIKVLGDHLVDGKHDPYATRLAISAMEKQMAQDLAIERWRGSTTYTGLPWPEGTAQRLPAQFEEALRTWNSIGDKMPRDVNGRPNFDAIDMMKQNFLSELKKDDPATFARLSYHVQQQEAENASKKPDISRFFDQVQATSLNSYYDQPEGTRTQWLREHGVDNAKLWVAGYVPYLYSPLSVAIASELAPNRTPAVRR